jgi:hypothetical protein
MTTWRAEIFNDGALVIDAQCQVQHLKITNQSPAGQVISAKLGNIVPAAQVARRSASWLMSNVFRSSGNVSSRTTKAPPTIRPTIREGPFLTRC